METTRAFSKNIPTMNNVEHRYQCGETKHENRLGIEKPGHPQSIFAAFWTNNDKYVLATAQASPILIQSCQPPLARLHLR